MATYELCNMSTFLDLASSFANLDPSLITETVTRNVVASMTTIPALIAQFNDATSGADINYYNAGLAAGSLVKTVFDITIAN
jgi:hypothetical protein